MDWASLLGPAVVAAVVSSIVAGVGFVINRSTSLQMHKEKLEADKTATERKVDADLALAEKKLSLDRKLADWKRRTELAEHVLADFYKARDVFADARRPFSFANEGSTRPGRGDGETEDLMRYRDSIYAPYERLLKEREFLAEMHSRRFRFMALFGNEAAEPFIAFVRAFNAVGSATGMLINDRGRARDETRERFERTIGWGVREEDEMATELEAAVRTIESLCAPVLREAPQ